MLSFGSLRAGGLITRPSAEVPLNTTEQMSYELLQEFRGDKTVISNTGGARRKSWILVAPSEEKSCQDRKTLPRAPAHNSMAIERKILTNFHLGKSYIIHLCSLLLWWLKENGPQRE